MNRVMIVDSDSTTKDFFTERFGGQYQIQMATDGQTALEQLIDFQPDVVIIEISLPDMPGRHLVQQMRKHIPNLPVIAVAATESWEEARKMRVEAEPIFFYAVKPLDGEEIQKAVDAAVALQHRRLG